MSNDTVIVKLLDKDYQVACPPGQEAALVKSADYLDNQLRTIRANGKVIGLERIAVMAALNISNELLHNNETNKQPDSGRSNSSQIKNLNDKLEEALHRFRQFEIS